MQNTTTATPTDQGITDASQTASVADPRPAYARAVRLATDVVAAVRPDQLDDPTPCDEMDVREMIRHIHMTILRAAAVTRTATAGGEMLPTEDRSIGDDDWNDAFAAAGAAAVQAWSDDDLLTTTLTLPWMQAEGAHVLGVYLNETLAHTWDLATATGQRPAWRDDDVEIALVAIRRELPEADRTAMWEAVRQTIPPEVLDGQPWKDPFDNAVPVPDTAPAIERLVAWQGRDPRST